MHGPFAAPAADVARNLAELAKFPFDAATPQFADDSSGVYRTRMRQDHAIYAGMVENVDYNVGRVLQSLSEGAPPGIKADTIVIFTSDHGGLSTGSLMPGCTGKSGVTSNAPLRAGKGHLYEGGIRVPLFVRWPRVLAPRADAGSAIMGMDVLPTALDLAGGGAAPNIDGRSFAQVLRGAEDWADRPVFWHNRQCRTFATGDSAASAVRRGRYKLLHFLGPGHPWLGQAELDTCAHNFGRLALYDLHADPSEAVNLADAEPELAHAMLVELTEWKRAKSALDQIPACTLPRGDRACADVTVCLVCTPERPCYNMSGAACTTSTTRTTLTVTSTTATASPFTTTTLTAATTPGCTGGFSTSVPGFVKGGTLRNVRGGTEENCKNDCQRSQGCRGFHYGASNRACGLKSSITPEAITTSAKWHRS